MSWLKIIPNRLCARVEFVPRDFWVGAYWRSEWVITEAGNIPFVTDVWVCIIPTLPFHFQWFYNVLIPFNQGPDTVNNAA